MASEVRPTCTCNAISSVSLVTGTGEIPRSVNALGESGVTVISTSSTLINICRAHSTWEEMGSGGLTSAGGTIPTVSLVAGTGETTNGISTSSISVTVISASHALINIWGGGG